METPRCPNCDEPLPEQAHYCAKCGESMTSPGHKSLYFLAHQAQEDTIPLQSEPSQDETLHDGVIQDETIQDYTIQDETIQNNIGGLAEQPASDKPVALMVVTEAPVDVDGSGETPHDALTPSGGHMSPAYAGGMNSTPSGGSMSPPEMGGMDTPHDSLAALATTPHDGELASQQWHGLDDENFDPLSMRHMTWHKEVKSLTAHTPAPFLAKPAPPRQTLSKPQSWRSKVSPKLFFWVSLVVIVVLLLGGAFGIVVALGRGLPGMESNGLALSVTPNSVTVGATITLRGMNFTPHGRIGLTRDTAIPVVDTSGAVVTQADGNGNFTDTVVVTADWEPGAHTLYAEDAASHKIASFPVTVTGGSALLRPAHLELSVDALDFGSGAQNISSFRAITLTNIGSGQIPWLANSSQPWIQVGPRSGVISSGQGQRVIIAVDRSHLQPGSYNGQITFSSNAGIGTIGIRMQVSAQPSLPAGVAALQVSPPLLSFSALDGGSAPPAQTITVSNPGTQALQWQATSNSSWLSVSPQSGTVGAGSSAALRVNVNSGALLPGTYNGAITLNGLGSGQVQGSPQTINISVTITPPCTLQISPSMLTFTGVANQAAPGAQTVNLGLSQGCKSSLQWSTSTSASWLNVSAQHGATPASPSIGVNTGGLNPGNYSGSVVFSSSAGTQTVFVNFTLAQQTTPLLNTSPSALTFNSVVGQASPPAQAIQITDAGNAALSWQATATTSAGGSWLALSQPSGHLGAHQSASLGVSATLLSSLGPGTYAGSITISGFDGSGHAAPGSPQTIPVKFVVSAACTFNANPTSLSFAGGAGQAALHPQTVSLVASGACANALNWSAQVATSSGGTWLSATPGSGSVTLNNAGSVSVGANPGSLNPGTYQGTVTITATDSATQATVGSPQVINVTLTVQPPCTLQAPTNANLSFTVEMGANPSSQTFSIAVNGGCAGKVTITPSVSLSSGSGWLAVSPSAANIQPGGSASFTVTVKSAGLAAGSYSGSISLGGTNGGVAIAGSPQTVSVGLIVKSSPALGVSPSSLTINVTSGTQSQPVTISNTGGSPLSWTAALAKGDPSFVSLSSTADKNLAGGASDTINVSADATGVQSGTYTATVTIAATDPATGATVSGSPVKVPVTINVAPPQAQFSTTNLGFSTNTGANPDPQQIVLTNSGGGTLTWQAGQPSESWLTVTPTSGSDAAGATSQITFTVNTSGLGAGNYTATVMITPSVGNPVTITVTLAVTDPTPTPTPDPTATPSPPPQPSPSPTPTATPDPTPTPAPSPTPTATPDPTPTPAPSPTPTATPDPTPQPQPPAMSLSTTSLSFPATTGSNPDVQTIEVTNSGGGTLTWQAAQARPLASWLVVAPTSGSTAAGASSPLTFTVDPSGLTVGNYSATVVVTPSVGQSVAVTVTLTVAAPSPSPTATAHPR